MFEDFFHMIAIQSNHFAFLWPKTGVKRQLCGKYTVDLLMHILSTTAANNREKNKNKINKCRKQQQQQKQLKVSGWQWFIPVHNLATNLGCLSSTLFSMKLCVHSDCCLSCLSSRLWQSLEKPCKVKTTLLCFICIIQDQFKNDWYTLCWTFWAFT